MYQELMPNWKKSEQCWLDEQIEVVDSFHKKPILNKTTGKPLIAAYPHDKPVAQLSYEEFLKIIVTLIPTNITLQGTKPETRLRVLEQNTLSIR